MKEPGVFIKGEWVLVRPWDEDYTKYYCCPACHGIIKVVQNPPGTIPHWYQVYCCELADNREIGLQDEEWYLSVRRPDWCPLHHKEGE
jgi:hypothetical protein